MSEFHTIEEYVKAAQCGEETGWNILYQHYYPHLYATALQISKDMDVAKDAVQDTFIKAHLKLAQLKDIAAFGGWIKKILINTCYRLARYNQNKYPNSLPVESDSWWEDEFNKKLEKLYTQSQLYAILAQLPEVLRSALLLRYFSDFESYEEIASILSIPVGTVRSRLNQAKLKLAEQWQRYADSDLKIFKQSQEWNHFYHTAFSGMHQHDEYKNRLMTHLQRDVHLILSGGKQNTGRGPFEKMIVEDRKAGSWLIPANVTSCGNITIVEAEHFNSPENPNHCPPRSVLVLYRNKQKVDKINFHISVQ